MTVIGITGTTGAGKTTALNAVRELGGLVIDCDEYLENVNLLDIFRMCKNNPDQDRGGGI